MLADLRFAFRQLIKSPSFTFVAVLALALGIGANTAIFTVVNAVLLKPLPFPEPERLVATGTVDLRETDAGATDSLNNFSYPDFFDLRERASSFGGQAVYRERSFALVGENEAQSLRGLVVSGEFFDVLGVRPLLGRAFTRADEALGGGPGGLTVVLSHDFWQRHFRGDRAAVGKEVTLDGRTFIVIGVMPEGFQFPIQPEGFDVYITPAIAAEPPPIGLGKPITEQRGSHGLRGIARLKPDVSLAQARAELKFIAAALEKEYPETNAASGMTAADLRESFVGNVRTALLVLLGAVGCVLLIACVNVANLLLARATARGREMAVRAALGAGRGRIVRQLLTESLVLAALGGLLGLLFARWGTDALVALVPDSIPRVGSIALEGSVLAFTFGVSMLTGVVFGLAPALQGSRADLNQALRAGSRGSGGDPRRHRLRAALVVAQTALALVLLVGAGLLLRSFAELGRVRTGVQPERLFTARVSLPVAAYPRPENVAAFYDALGERLRAIPGVRAASFGLPTPLSGSNSTSSFNFADHPLPKGQEPDAASRLVGADYFAVMGVPVVRGRAFTAADRLGTPLVMVINERFAQKHFPGEDPVGKHLTPSFSLDGGEPPVREIVGVVGNVKFRSLSMDFVPEMYLPASQVPSGTATLVLRAERGDPLALTSAVRGALAEVDRNLPLTRVRTFEDYVDRALARPKFNTLLLGIFAGVALLLTAVGIYGVMAYSVSQRTGEIGVRMALGAGRGSIFRLIVGQGMALVAVSIGLGLAGAFALMRLLSSLLYGVSAWDPLTFGAISLLIALVAFLACWLPARRAARVNPIEALRAD